MSAGILHPIKAKLEDALKTANELLNVRRFVPAEHLQPEVNWQRLELWPGDELRAVSNQGEVAPVPGPYRHIETGYTTHSAKVMIENLLNSGELVEVEPLTAWVPGRAAYSRLQQKVARQKRDLGFKQETIRILKEKVVRLQASSNQGINVDALKQTANTLSQANTEQAERIAELENRNRWQAERLEETGRTLGAQDAELRELRELKDAITRVYSR